MFSGRGLESEGSLNRDGDRRSEGAKDGARGIIVHTHRPHLFRSRAPFYGGAWAQALRLCLGPCMIQALMSVRGLERFVCIYRKEADSQGCWQSPNMNLFT
jgi:hypothetical protein